MLAALALIVPLGLSGAISPVLLTEQTVLLAGPGGRRAARQFAIGAILTLLVVVALITIFGRAISLPSEPRLSASLDLALGVVLLLIAVAVGRKGRGKEASRAGDGGGSGPRNANRSRGALPFGVFSMTTNFTTLALMIPAAKEISTADTGTLGRALLVLVLVGLASGPAWLPLALTRIAPGPGQRALTAFGDLIDRRGREATVAVLAGAGLFFAIRGVIRLIGG